MRYVGCVAVVMRLICCVYASASSFVPPTSARIPGAPTSVKAPQPTVSVMAESPMSSPASAAEYPGRNSPSTTGDGATNHSSPRPATWIPNSVPFRHIATTRLLYSTSRAGSAMALPLAMARPRNSRLCPVRYPSVGRARSRGTPAFAMAIAIWLANRLDAALWRLCSSSPICSAWTMMGSSSSPPICCSASRNVGAHTSRQRRRPSSASGP